MEERSSSRPDHLERTKFLKPVETVSYNSQDLLAGLFNAINPSHVSSVNLLHGDRKGVIRMTVKTREASADFDTKVELRRVNINGVRLAPVNESGHFIHVTLMDVPEYLGSHDVLLVLNEYGSVAHIKKEYFEFQGFQMENETRHILFSFIMRDLPEVLNIDGFDVYVSYSKHDKSRSMYSVNDLISQPGNIPKHVMNLVKNNMAAGDLLEKSRIFPKSHSRLVDYGEPEDGLEQPGGRGVSTGAAETGARKREEGHRGHTDSPKVNQGVKALSMADLPHCEEKEEFAAKYENELETLSLASRRPSLDRDDFSSSGRLGFLRRPSLDGSVDGSNNEGGRLDFNNLSSGNSRSSRSSAGPSGTSNRYISRQERMVEANRQRRANDPETKL